MVDLLTFTYQHGLDILGETVHKKSQNIPGSIQYEIRRVKLKSDVFAEEKGMLVYQPKQEQPNKKPSNDNFIELRFCTFGNKYCFEKSCSYCNELPTNGMCNGNVQTADMFVFHFSSTFLHMFTNNVKVNNKKDAVLAFKEEKPFLKIFSLTPKNRRLLDDLLNYSYTGASENIYLNAKIHELLLLSLDCLVEDKDLLFTCKFLADEDGRNRIEQAKNILLERIGEPITIKELSKKIATNECYLKKGFKEMYGTTIFDFYQQQKMEHAKFLLYEKGLNVTEVSFELGYSSLSHFSSAFKKHTGIKPCELLN